MMMIRWTEKDRIEKGPYNKKRERIEVREIGQKSEQVRGFETFCNGVMTADFHCDGMMPESRDKLNIYVRGLVMLQAINFNNQYGRQSGPLAVALTLSYILKTTN